MNKNQVLLKNGHKGRGSDDWLTPESLYRYFENWFDASPEISEGLREFDGMGDWKDFTFVNPPYSDTEKWVFKAIEEARKGKRIVLLLRLDSSTKWFMALQEYGAHIFNHLGRMQYKGGGNAPFATILVFL